MSLFSDRSAHLIVYLPSTLVTIIVALFTEDFIVCVGGGDFLTLNSNQQKKITVVFSLSK